MKLAEELLRIKMVDMAIKRDKEIYPVRGRSRLDQCFTTMVGQTETNRMFWYNTRNEAGRMTTHTIQVKVFSNKKV